MANTPTQQAENVPVSQAVSLTHEGESVLFPALPYDIKARADHATHDEKLQASISNATLIRDAGRRDIFQKTFGDNYDAMRRLAGEIKQHTLDHLDYYLQQFVDNATQAGVQVHFAKDGKQANEICVAIAKQHDSKLCVKSKSMVTEETHLLPVLEAAGVKTIETDLGEFILQLDHDAPSHIVQPMIHKDRIAVAKAFEREINAPYTEDPKTLSNIAREYLREKYHQADIGISGGNFLVADKGSVVICTNEGNGRLTTSVPKVHIAMVGIEKVIPTAAHLSIFLKMLARSATSQPLTVYNHIMTGPKRDDEHDGPQEMHVILLDNGRTKILDEETREMLRCIRCGACLNACPVYRKIGGHSYGAVYPGPIGALITPMFKGLKNYKDLPYASSLCGACFEACPVHINIPKYLVQHRSQLVAMGEVKFVDKIMFKVWTWALGDSFIYRLGGWFSRKFLRAIAQSKGRLETGDPYVARGWVDKMPGPASGWTSERDLPTPPDRNFRQWWDEHEKGKV